MRFSRPMRGTRFLTVKSMNLSSGRPKRVLILAFSVDGLKRSRSTPPGITLTFDGAWPYVRWSFSLVYSLKTTIWSDLFRTVCSMDFLALTCKWWSIHFIGFLGEDVRLIYSSNDREWHVYTQGTRRLPVKERTPIAENGWWKLMMSKGKFSSKERNVRLQSDMRDLKKTGKSFSWKLYRCSSTPLIFSTFDSWYGNLRVKIWTTCPLFAKRVLSS